ncbi:uncharacterized protein I303_102385 [Kwoniella dejecticola CBS 10117]|uniref:Xylanolytic transcriptional activator regulatory domain-containing protein n=1 Tax=Kwoniella dejecticola CBS 10117 TaxID=1296121 RepID=A0A1A6AB47_9TREE|nr:uncharacterized protein I303_01476 [Kwoniella dejecticola CBS 10117]OBR87274.1 hypothetical protein I303_01476 [Kwoniella dejecticola CBS 10117]
MPDFLRLGAVLHAQAPTLSGVPGDEESLEVYYYRFSGSTAMTPGINRVNLRLRKRKAESPFTDVPNPESPHSPAPLLPPISDLFDEEGMPYPHIREPLFELFFQHLSQHFPAPSRQRMKERFESGTMSQFLAHSICAIAARFAPSPLDNPTQACAPFLSKAQNMLVPMMQLPSTETCSGLILLAWASYGQGSDTGLWQLSGMGIRMGLEIGLHKVSEMYDSPQHVVRCRLLFWTLFVTDRILAFAEGRETMIDDDIIEIPLPKDSDFFPDPARSTPEYPYEITEPVPFVYFTKLMVIVGRISNVLNGRRGKPRTLVPTVDAEQQSKLLTELQIRLIEFVANLPESLRWNLDNLKHQQQRGHSGILLALHLYCHAVLAMTYHPDLLKSPSGHETPLNRNMLKDMRLALESSKQISECIPLADLLDPTSYIGIPYMMQPISIGVSSLLHEIRSMEVSENPQIDPTAGFRISIAREKIAVLLKAATKVVQAWAAGRPALDVLKKRAGLLRPDEDKNRDVFVSLPDTGMVRRFKASKDHPQNIAQPTETSLRDAIMRQNASLNPIWLTSLMTDYTLEGMTYDPVENADLYRLVSGEDDPASFGFFATDQ